MATARGRFPHNVWPPHRNTLAAQRRSDCAKTALLTDLSGEGARGFARSLHDVEALSVKIALHDGGFRLVRFLKRQALQRRADATRPQMAV